VEMTATSIFLKLESYKLYR